MLYSSSKCFISDVFSIKRFSVKTYCSITHTQENVIFHEHFLLKQLHRLTNNNRSTMIEYIEFSFECTKYPVRFLLRCWIHEFLYLSFGNHTKNHFANIWLTFTAFNIQKKAEKKRRSKRKTTWVGISFKFGTFSTTDGWN